ncbi:hypothetical protein P7K49_032455, partial [Saguinus oedipus]
MAPLAPWGNPCLALSTPSENTLLAPPHEGESKRGCVGHNALSDIRTRRGGGGSDLDNIKHIPRPQAQRGAGERPLGHGVDLDGSLGTGILALPRLNEPA